MSSCARILRSFRRVASTIGNAGYRQNIPQLTQKLYKQTPVIQIICRHNSTKIEDPRTLSDKEWEERLTPEQYAVCREKRTEPPFTGKYVNLFDKGRYDCICCGVPLFSSEAKYDSGTGWPSFYEAMGSKDGDERYSNILRRSDNSGGMVRTEVLCKHCDSHLGHVFEDGPKPSGLRYCINSMPLLFKPGET